jgi:peptidoglycan/xylan/chitin deacetylase (PgdA/CDA1 family)
VRNLIAWSIRLSGLGALIRNTWARRRIGVVLYHDPDPATFEAHLEYLASRYSLISLSDAVEALRAGRVGDLPPKPLVLTIDDGYARNAALTDACARHGARPALFLVSQVVATTRRFWFTAVPDEEAEALKGLPTAERLERLAESGFTPEREYGEREGHAQALSAEQLGAMRGTFDLEAHTRFHPILTRCEEDEAREEIAGSREELARFRGTPAEHFAYPNGAYSDRDARLAREAGFASARTVDIGWNGRDADPYLLRILSIADDFTPTMLGADLAGLKRFSRLLRREGTLGGRYQPRWPGREIS